MKNKTFIKYYKKKFTTLREASTLFKYSRSAVHLWLHGAVVPSPKAIMVIAKKTNNEVPVESWFK